MINYKNILIGLFILLLTISPVSAASPADQTTSVDQTLHLLVPEVISIAVTPTILQFTGAFSSGNFYLVATTANVANVGNVKTDIFYRLKSNFTNGNTILNPSQYDYSMMISNKNNMTSNIILLYGESYLIKEWLEPGQSYSPYQGLRLPKIPPTGVYSATATYTAIKST